MITRGFAGGGPFRQPGLRILADLAAAYRIPFPHERYANGSRTTFTEMVATLVDELAGGGPLGLVVLAHGLPDAEPQWPACYLSGALPGRPLAFGVADAGLVTPFLGLRITAEHVRTAGFARAAVVILDQTWLLRDPAAGRAPEPTGNRAVALVFDRDRAIGELSVDLSAPVTVDAARRALGERAGTAGPGHPLVVGGGLAGCFPVPGGPGTVPAPAGLPCTGPWLAAAPLLRNGARRRGTSPRRVTLLEYDPALSVLGSCAIELDGRVAHA